MRIINICDSAQNKVSVGKITALWAFSEAALGGILHLLRIPFTGLFIGSSAVIFISLIAFYSDSRYTIIESAIKVILVKFIVSPYTPINAYFAVIMQTILGFLLFFGGFNKISAIILGFVSLLLSGIQKIIITTLIFGMTFWESIDVFIDFLISRISPGYQSADELTFSIGIVSVYMLLHILGGFAAGWYAALLPERISKHGDRIIDISGNNYNNFLQNPVKRRGRRKWWLKPSSIFVILLSFFLISISFLFEDVEQSIATRILIMLTRSIIIILVWYYFISPLLLKLLNKLLNKRKKEHMQEINNIVEVFPNIKSIIRYSWKESEKYKSLKRPIFMIDNILINYLLLGSDSDDQSN